MRTIPRYGGFLRYADHVVNPLRTITAPIPVNLRELACETHFSQDLMRSRPALEAVAHAKYS